MTSWVAVVLSALREFPAESVPDGHVIAIHHLYIGLGFLAYAIWVVRDDLPRREPLLAMAGVMVAFLAFQYTWPWYPATGAALTLLGVALALVGVLWPGGVWTLYPLRWRVLAAFGVYCMADDAVSHAFGVWTPLDAGWGQVYHLVP